MSQIGVAAVIKLDGTTSLDSVIIKAGSKEVPSIVRSMPVSASKNLDQISMSIDTSNYVPGNVVFCEIQCLPPGATEWMPSASITWVDQEKDVDGNYLPAWTATHTRSPPFPAGTAFRHELRLTGPGLKLQAAFNAAETLVVTP